MGRDVKSVGLFRAPRVSIHAPAWGATPRGRGSGRGWCGFNPRARVGRDRLMILRFSMLPVFQSTRPRGARHAVDAVLNTDLKFQSTRPRGARHRYGRSGCQCSIVSIHAPAWGATGVWEKGCYGRLSFNPRARVGRDIPKGAKAREREMFQSTRPRGARPPHHNSLRDKDFFRVIREPLLPLDPKGTGQVAATQKANEISMLLKCEPSRESRTA